MITKETVKNLEVIFSDAYLIDIDFSQWDMNIGICVTADHYPSKDGKRGPILMLRFRRVWKMDFSFHHHDYFTKHPSHWSGEKRFQWPIYKSEIKRDHISRLILSGAEQFPILITEFEDVDIEELDRSVLAKINPAWTETRAGLARPGLIELNQLATGGNTKIGK
jgi:hypothetical protein